jgi:hypothetical protein
LLCEFSPSRPQRPAPGEKEKESNLASDNEHEKEREHEDEDEDEDEDDDRSCAAIAGFPLATRRERPHVAAMQSHELLREVFHKASPKQVAADLGLSLSLIYKWAEPPEEGAGSGAANPLDRIEALLRSTGDARVVQWICERAGGFFIKNPKALGPHPEFLIPATNQIVQEFADLLAVIATAAADNQITRREAESIRARWEELKSVTEGFVQCSEHGNFAPLREKSHPSPPRA